MKTNAIMYCCRSEKHIGHLHRSIEVARKLSESFNVTILLDDTTPVLVDVPESVQLRFLPALSVDPDSNVFDFAQSQQLRESIIVRRDVILAEFERLKPNVVIVDNFPFTQHRLRGEILPLIERAHNGVYGESLVVCTTDGIMIDETASGDDRADIAADLINKYFDLVIVQSDSVFARIEEFFQPRNTLQTPLLHTGFVTHDRGERPLRGDGRGDSILVSAGDGRFGGTLFRAAVEAHRVTRPVTGLRMKIVCGPRLPEDEFNELEQQAAELDGIEITRYVACIADEMARSRCSISQCGYNTALGVVATQTPALFIPCHDNQRREQIVRAQRLVYWGAGRLLMPHHLNSASLTNEINQLLQFQPRRVRFEMDGARNAVSLIERALQLNAVGQGASLLTVDGKRPH